MRVLVMDDDQDITSLLRSLLSNWSYEPMLAADEEEAFAIMDEPDAPRIVLLDIMMPGNGGLDICQSLRHRCPGALYIIFLTCLDTPEDLLAGFAAGGDDYITKPFSQNELQARLRVGARTVQHQLELERKNLKLDEQARTQKKLMEKLEQQTQRLLHSDRLAQVGTMLAAWLHEINNPLLMINANIQLLARYWDTMRPVVMAHVRDVESRNDRLKAALRETPQTLHAIRDGMRRIEGLVQRMRNQTKAPQEYDPAIDLNAALAHVLEMMHGYLKDEVTVETDFADGLPPTRACVDELEQVFMNLLINAYHAMEDQSDRRIRISSSREGDILRVDIQDNGPGIPVDLRQHIWDPFFSTKGEKGTGLGLFIVHTILERHEGSIEIADPAPDSPWATHFLIHLPVSQG